MMKTIQTLELICGILHREMGASCSTKHAHGDILGSAAVAVAPITFPDGSRYLLQVTKLIVDDDAGSAETCTPCGDSHEKKIG